MVGLLIRKLIKNSGDTSDPKVRTAYGMLCGACGIFFNILLFAAKLLAGLLSGSIAVTADAFNNLSDAGSSIITLVGFRLAGKKPDPDHPFGHGRLEYVSGLIVSFLILLMGYELGRSSIEKLIEPVAPDFGFLTAGILVFSVLVKIYMSYYNGKYGKKINSAAMEATAKDSLSDTISTTAVLIAGIICRLSGFVLLDGICGLVVSVLIFIAGYGAAKETISPLLGQMPDPEFVKSIEKITLSDEKVLGIHDLVVHDYGPGRVMVSLHCEMDNTENIMVLHEHIDAIESELSDKLGCEAVIHLDPIDRHDPKYAEITGVLTDIVKNVEPHAKFHDLRLVPGEKRTNVIFDLLLPAGAEVSGSAVKEKISSLMREYSPEYFCVIKIDTDYAGITTF